MYRFFYDEQGKSMDVKEFVDHYSRLYFEGSAYSDINSEVVEKRIKEILKKKSENGDYKFKAIEVKDILAWKIGKINHNKSNSENKVEYIKPWDGDELRIYGTKIDIDDITERINSVDPNISLSDYINSIKCPGIGEVYIITLRYFASGGRYPIYDQFAYRAIKAIKCDTKSGFGIWIDNPDTTFEKSNLSDDNKFSYYSAIVKANIEKGRFRIIYDAPDTITVGVYAQYKNDIEEVFKDYKINNDESEIEKNRKIDQALWVYGHYYKSKVKKYNR